MGETVQDIAKKIDEYEGQAAGLNEATLKRLCGESRMDATAVYGEPKYLFSQNGVGFSPLGDIQMVKAPQKNGKSFLFALLMGAMLSGEYLGIKCEVENPRVLYIDTEQHPRNTQLVYRRACKIGGISGNENHENFEAYHFRGHTPNEIAQSVVYLIDEFKPTAVFIDGVRDLVEDFNSLEESSNIVRTLMETAMKHECAIWSILHVNPGSDKARGHLGTEMQHKVSDVFTVVKEKTDEGTTFTVSQTDARNKDINNFKFVIEGVTDGDKLIAIPVAPHLAEKDKKEAENTVVTILKDRPGNMAYYNDLRDQIMEVFGISDRPARKKIKAALEIGLIEREPISGKMRLVTKIDANDNNKTLPKNEGKLPF